VKKSKTYFEQIPVEMVKKIAKELPQKVEEEQMGNGKGGLKTPNGNTEACLTYGRICLQKGRLK
jgi:hypothetical protein